MELAPSETGIPFDRLPAPRLLPVYRPQDVNIVVRRHPLEYQIQGQGMLRVHVASPVDRLYPVVQRHSMKRSRRCPASLRVSTCIRSTASPLSSIPALSLGLLVVCLFTWEKACQRQRWTMVCGHTSATAR